MMKVDGASPIAQSLGIGHFQKKFTITTARAYRLDRFVWLTQRRPNPDQNSMQPRVLR